MILLWGLPADRPLARVLDVLRERGSDLAVLDQRAVAEMELEPDGDSSEGLISVGGRRIDLADVTAAYIRPYDSRRLPWVAATGEDGPAWRRALELDEFMLGWADVTRALVVNRPEAMCANSSKPFQSRWIASLGFAVPATLVTNDREAALEFWELHGSVVYKSIGGTRSIVSRLGREHRARLDDLASCPTQFQVYVPGVDHRVHVVRDEVFACRIRSDGDDYRYARRGGLEIEPCALPPDVAQRCRRLSAEMGLPVAGIDLRLTPEGEWFCFEVNPSPGYSYYEAATGQPISRAIADLLETIAPLRGSAPRHPARSSPGD